MNKAFSAYRGIYIEKEDLQIELNKLVGVAIKLNLPRTDADKPGSETTYVSNMKTCLTFSLNEAGYTVFATSSALFIQNLSINTELMICLTNTAHVYQGQREKGFGALV